MKIESFEPNYVCLVQETGSNQVLFLISTYDIDTELRCENIWEKWKYQLLTKLLNIIFKTKK